MPLTSAFHNQEIFLIKRNKYFHAFVCALTSLWIYNIFVQIINKGDGIFVCYANKNIFIYIHIL